MFQLSCELVEVSSIVAILPGAAGPLTSSALPPFSFFFLLGWILYVVWFPYGASPQGIALSSEGVPEMLKNVTHLSLSKFSFFPVCEMCMALVFHSAHVGVRELVGLESLLLLCVFWDQTQVVGLGGKHLAYP